MDPSPRALSQNPFSPAVPGQVFLRLLPSSPIFPLAIRELRGLLCASRRPRASFLLFYLHYSDPAGSSTRCHQPCKGSGHGHQSAWDSGKWPLWAHPPLELGRAQKHGPCGVGMGDLTVDCSQVKYTARHSLTPTSNLSANLAGSDFIKSIQNLPDHLHTMAAILVLSGPSM